MTTCTESRKLESDYPTDAQRARVARMQEVFGQTGTTMRPDPETQHVDFLCTDEDGESEYVAVIREDGTLFTLYMRFTEAGMVDLRAEGGMDDVESYADWTDIEGGDFWERIHA